MLKDFPIVGSFNNERFEGIDAERSVNLFEYRDPNGKKPSALLSTSGILDSGIRFTGNTGGVRAEFVYNKGNTLEHYCVVGNTVYLITSGGSVAALGTLMTSTGYVKFDANTFQVMVVDGQGGYIWDTTHLVFRQITDTGFPSNPIDLCYLDGFFIVASGQTNNFYLSEFNQGMLWSNGTLTFTADAGTDILTVSSTANFQTGLPVEVSTTGTLPAPLAASTTYYTIRVSATELRLATTEANAFAGTFIDLTTNGVPTNTITNNGQLQQGAITAHPGTIVGCRTLHRRVFFFSQNFTEVWENQGIGTNLPIRRNNSLLIEYGTPAVGSIATGFDRMFFLSQDKDGLGSVMEVMGAEAIPISTRALDFALQGYASNPNQGVSDCRAFLVKENGLIFYRMNFTAANHTYVFNVTLSNREELLWHEEEVLNGDRHPAQTHAYFNGVNYYGDYQHPILYIVSSSYVTNDGEAIKRMRITRPIVPEGYNRIRCNRMHVDLRQGYVGNLVDSGTQVLLTESALDILAEDLSEIILEQTNAVIDASQPIVWMSVSKDGGQTYLYRVQGLMGGLGQRSFRTVWRKLPVIPRGQAFVSKFEFFHNVPFIVLGAAWDFDILPE